MLKDLILNRAKKKEFKKKDEEKMPFVFKEEFEMIVRKSTKEK